MEYKILDVKDIPSMKELVIEGFRQFSYKTLKDFIKTPNHYGFIAKDDDIVVGLCYGHLLKRPDNKNASVFYIFSLGVLDDFQNQGVGTHLLTFVKDFAFEKLNVSKCFWTTEKTNIQAHSVYNKLANVNEDEIIYVAKNKNPKHKIRS